MQPEERLRKKLKGRLSKSWELVVEVEVVVAIKEIEMTGVVIASTGEEGADMVVIVEEMTIMVATKDLLEMTDVRLDSVVRDEVALDIIDELIINSSPCFWLESIGTQSLKWILN